MGRTDKAQETHVREMLGKLCGRLKRNLSYLVVVKQSCVDIIKVGFVIFLVFLGKWYAIDIIPSRF